MSRKSFCFALALMASVFSGAASAYYSSSLGRFQAYASTWYNSYGNPVGIKVHYSIGELRDRAGYPSHYAAVCINTGSGSGPCIEQTAKAWTKTTSYYSIGTWVTQYIPMTCNSTVWRVQVHQPYVYHGSTLNYHVYGGSPYQNGQLFYSGSSDTANFQVSNCAQ